MDRTISISACGINKRQVLAIGRQMENNYRQIIFDCSGFGVEVASVTLVHQRSLDMAPYIVETSSTDTLAWTVTNTDTAYAGYGKAELRITFTNGLAKSVVFTTMVIQSITADTTIPQPLQSWYDAMIDYIDEHSISPEELAQAIEDYLDEHPIQAPVQSVNGETGDVVITAADLGALTAELDPVFGASAAAGITSADITAWNGKYTKPSSGIPATDLTSTVQSRLLKTGGTTGQVLAKKSNSNYDTEWVNQSGGGGAVDSVNGKTGTVVLDASDVGALPDTTTASDLGAYVKPTGGIPKEDLASAVQTSLGKADTALQTAVTSFNGSTGAVTYTAPVTSVNGATGAITVAVPTKTSDLQNDSGFLTSAPVSSVDGKTGAVNVIPTGGTTGQVLSKASGTNYDVEWATPSGGSSSWTRLKQIDLTGINIVHLDELANYNEMLFGFYGVQVATKGNIWFMRGNVTGASPSSNRIMVSNSFFTTSSSYTMSRACLKYTNDGILVESWMHAENQNAGVAMYGFTQMNTYSPDGNYPPRRSAGEGITIVLESSAPTRGFLEVYVK